MTTQAMTKEMMEALGNQAGRQLISLFEKDATELTEVFNKVAAACKGDVTTIGVSTSVTLKHDKGGNFSVGVRITAGKPFSDFVTPEVVDPNQPELFPNGDDDNQPEE